MLNNNFYSLDNILKLNADYNIIIGERSNGKTYACLEYGLNRYIKSKGCEKMAIIRRWDEDIIGGRGNSMFTALEKNGVISELTNKELPYVKYYNRQWYLASINSKTGRLIPEYQPFCYGFSLSRSEHDKSTSFPDVTTIIFDEFLTRTRYLADEFVIFMNVLSTIIRQRNNVKIFMLGNTVNKYAPYFTEFGLKHITTMQQGAIDLYTYGNSNLQVAVEYCASSENSKPSNKYFAFDNPKLKMITKGMWEMSLYPHLSVKYKPNDILFTYYIVHEDNILQAEIIQIDNDIFTYIHRKTTPLKQNNDDVVFTLDANEKYLYRSKLYGARLDKFQSKIAWFFEADKVFYQDNEIGEIVRNFTLATLYKSFANVKGK